MAIDNNLITIQAVNLAPTDITLDLFKPVTEEDVMGYMIGTLSATDPEGDAVTWSLPEGHEGSPETLTQEQNDDNNTLQNFSLVQNQDGTVGVRIKRFGGLEHEWSAFEGGHPDGNYALVVLATDSAGNQTRATLFVQSANEYIKFSAAPTGKDYAGLVENVEAGQEVGYLGNTGQDFIPKSVKLTDDSDGLFAIRKSMSATGEARFALVVNGPIDYETAASHSITFRATDANGVSHKETVEIKVIDAPEAGDKSRGRITIDANTMLAAQNGGVDWDSYINRRFENYEGGLPTGATLDGLPVEEYFYTNPKDGDLVSLRGSDIVYNWQDPVSGEDVHVVSGTITSVAFGNESAEHKTGVISKPEVTISGLDVTSGSGLMDRIYGEANTLASVFMHSPLGKTPAEVEHAKAILASYAQVFEGSSHSDSYTGTVFNDIVRGHAGTDRIDGGFGADRVHGGTGADVIRGGAGNDGINGGGGTDRLYGGTGADTFFFANGDAGKSRSSADIVFDFKPQQGDTIDLSAIDANVKKNGDQAFDFIGDGEFGKHAGELRFTTENNDTWIEGDIDGNGKVDFIIHLNAAVNLVTDHFEL